MTAVPAHIFREYDIRGLAEEELTPQVVEAVGRAHGTILAREGVTTATVGGDVRHSSPRIRENIIAGLTAAGIDVIDIGRVCTPTFYWSLYRFDVAGGVMVTGSHNPREFNGLKLAMGKATLWGSQIQEILRIIREDAFAAPERNGTVRQQDINDEYIDMLASKITLGPRKVRVAADAGNGAASMFMRPFLERIGAEVYPLYDEPDGDFPNHHPDPTIRENLTDLIATVRENGLDLGIGFDGDADRIGVVDDQGNVIWGDTLMALFWRELLPKHPGATAIVEVKSSQALVEEVERLGGKPLFWKSGHSLIKAKMREIDALFAGEVSGHMFFADEFFGFDDAIYAAGRLLRLLSESDRSLSEMVAEIPSYPSTAETRVPCPDERKFDIVEEIKESALRDYDAITVDGVRILYPHGWGLVRASNTQPVLVARAEGTTQAGLEHITKDLKSRLLEAGVEDFDWAW